MCACNPTGLVVAVMLGVVSPGDEYSTKKPRALLNFERARTSIRKADVEWNVVDSRGDMAHQRRFRRSLFANGDLAYFTMGTKDGVTAIGEDGEAQRMPRHWLQTKDEVWELEADWVKALAYKGTREQVRKAADTHMLKFDARNLGMAPTTAFDGLADEMLWTFPRTDEARRYRERKVDGLHEVSMLAGKTEVRWFIDPDKGWNAVRTEMWYDGKKTNEAVSALREYDGAWFPQAVAYYSSVSSHPFTVVEVSSAKLNRPDLPDRLTPKHIGLDAGMSVQLHDGEKWQMLWWDGSKAVSTEEYRERKLKAGPRVRAWWEERHIPHLLQEWEAIVQRFIKKHDLTRTQTESALAILKDCADRAKAMEDPSDEKLDRIKTTELVLRLNELLTSEQREAAKKRDKKY